MTYKEMEEEILRLRSMLDERIAEDIKYRRSLEDMMYNLSFDNMPTVEQEAKQTAFAVSGIEGKINGVERGVSTISQAVDDQGAKIALVVESRDGKNVINTASIVSAINDSESSIKMSADKIEFEGTSITFDTDALNVNAKGRVAFKAPITAPDIYTTCGYFNGRVDLGSSEGLVGYTYLNCGESNALELCGDGGVVISTYAESGDESGDVDIYADNLKMNGHKVLTRSAADIAYLRDQLGLV